MLSESLLLNSLSTRLEPMKPAEPVMRKRHEGGKC